MSSQIGHDNSPATTTKAIGDVSMPAAMFRGAMDQDARPVSVNSGEILSDKESNRATDGYSLLLVMHAGASWREDAGAIPAARRPKP